MICRTSKFRLKIITFTILASTTFIVANSYLTQSSGEFFNIKTSPTSYIYVPAFMCTELMMGRYLPYFIASTGEVVTWHNGGHVIGEPHSAVIFPEISLKKSTSFTLNPITAFINSIRRDLFPFLQRVLKDTYQFTIEENTSSSESIIDYSFAFSQANFGQNKDVHALCKTYQTHVKKYPNTDVILYGDSRGAVVIFNFLATHKASAVKAAVLEGIYDNLSHYIKHLVYVDKEPNTEARLHGIAAFLMRSYNKKGPFARDYINSIPLDIPLLLVSSLQDKLVNPQCTFYLYTALKNRGHTKVHLIILKNASHPSYMVSNEIDKQIYERTVHAFYKHYGLPHNSTLATLGEQYFAYSQPTAQELHTFAIKHSLPWCDLCYTPEK